MLINYLKTTLRNLLKNKLYTLINILGLCLGMSCALLILLYMYDELSYDTFHTKAARIYRAESSYKSPNTNLHQATSAGPLAQQLTKDFPEVEKTTRVAFRGNSWYIAHKNRKFFEKDVRAADANFFEVFTHRFIYGNPQNALVKPHSVVVTASLARKIFGSTKRALSQVIQIDDTQSSYTITAVVEDVPKNAHFNFTALFSVSSLDPIEYKNFLYNWSSNNFYTYILLKKGVSIAQLRSKMPAFCQRVIDPQNGDFKGKSHIYLKALTDIHLAKRVDRDIAPQGDMTYIYIFSAIALFVILIAMINYINLASARAFTRAKEVGIRKVAGSSNAQLVQQFMVESILLVFLAFVLALNLTELTMPMFNYLTGKDLSIGVFFTPVLGGAMLVGVLFLGLLSGLYPALVLANFQVVKILKGKFTRSREGTTLRKGLVVFQFTVSVVMIVGTLVVYHQLAYVQNHNLGFEQAQVVVLPIQDFATRKKIPALKQALLKYPKIQQVAMANFAPGYGGGVSRNTLKFEAGKGKQELVVDHTRVGYDFFELLNLPIVKGRNFSREMATDATKAVIINETLARRFHWTQPLGKRVGYHVSDAQSRTGFRMVEAKVIGVVQDFHRKSLRSKIAPMVLQPAKNGGWRLLLKVQPQQMPQTIRYIAQTWEKAGIVYPFRSFFLDQKFAEQYQSDQKRGQVFLIFAGLTIFIACLGLFGLATFIARQRRKEIGVRKVLGASVLQILRLMTKDFMLLVLIANLIAAPIAYYSIQDWLANFAYRTHIPWYVFVVALVFTSLLSLLTISIQSWRVAKVNPATVLKDE